MAGVPVTDDEIPLQQVLFNAFAVCRTDKCIFFLQRLNIAIYIREKKQASLKLQVFYMKFGVQFLIQETDAYGRHT